MADSSSPIVRTVRQVVEVIPPLVWLLVAALAALTLFGAAGSWLLAARQRRLERQREELLEDVGLLQRALLPSAPERIAGVATSVAYRPAPGGGAGGDFYDVFALDGERLGVMIGDVSCGGRRGLGLTAIVRHTLRAYLEAGMSPRAALQVASRALEHQLGGDQARVTAGVYDRETGVLTFASAGHPPPVVVGAAAFEPVTACASPPLGCGRPTGLRQTSVALPSGSLVCLYTDGFIHARVGGELFGYRRLSLALTALGGRTDARALVERVASQADATPDDMAACVLRVAPHMRAVTSPGGVRRLEELELSREDLDGGRPADFMAACGLPSDRIDALVAGFRATGERLGAGVLRVRIGPGVPRAELALNRVDVLAGSGAAAR